MAHASAQREPSMEEILASIRRIIEDSDTVKKPSPFRAGAAEPEDMADDEEPVTFEPANSDVVTFLRGEEPAGSAMFDQSAATSVESPADAPADAPDLSPAAADDFELPDDFGAELEELRAELAGNEQTAAAPEGIEPAPAKAEPAMAPRQPIVSDRTGRQVAASFGELSEVFAASRRKSFDEMAEEMLRPMLQDWLDDNLPTLVERLVREEIERVARGGAR